jgi:quercetin dioxygenase-like cupin family protein
MPHNTPKTAGGKSMFQKKTDHGYIKVFDGVERKTPVYGDKTLMTEFRLRGGHELPRHSHPYEQTGILIYGRIVLLVGQDEFEAGPGDTWCIPGDVEHGARILEDSLAVEVFAPVRPDYLPESR